MGIGHLLGALIRHGSVKMIDYDYSKAELKEALRCAGIQEGDILYCHVAMSKLGIPKEQLEGKTKFNVIYEALLEAIGPQGTLLTPTFTYSFCYGQIYDPVESPSTVGYFGENLRKLQGAKRSLDPLFSSAGIGHKIDELFQDLPNESFGKDCLFDRLGKIGAKLCNIGVDLFFTTFNHFVQEMFGVPYRFPKLFSGYVRLDGKLVKQNWIYSVRTLGDYSQPCFDKMQPEAVEKGICRIIPVGKGNIVNIPLRDMYELFTARLCKDPWDCAVGPPCDPVQKEEERVGVQKFCVCLPPGATMKDMIDELWELPRDIISDGYDVALRALSQQVPMKVHEYKTGSRCFTWIVPEKWTCREAYLESLDGRRIFSYKDNPLHVVSYSLPFEGEITKEELFKHLHTHPKLSEAIPFRYTYYERDWGLCCSSRAKEALAYSKYRVTIKSDFSYGKMKVGEIIAEGKQTDSIVLCAHLCHSHMVNDNLTGVVVGIEVMRQLLKRKNPRFTYRFLIIPETIGLAAYLAHNEDLIPTFRGVLFIEMLGKNYPFILQKSSQANSIFDKTMESIVKEHDPEFKIEPFLQNVLNNERMSNALGIQVPMLSIARTMPKSHEGFPYEEYHSSLDTPDNIDLDNLKESKELILKIIDAVEANGISFEAKKKD